MSTCFELVSHLIFSYDRQGVSNIAHVVKGCLITSLPMSNRLWVTLHIQALSSLLCLTDRKQVTFAHFVKGSLITSLVWPTGSEWCGTFYERHTTSISMTNSLWVTLHILQKLSHHISCNQQGVSDIDHFGKGCLITPFSIIDSLWVTLHIVVKGSLISLHFFLWPTACVWNCTLLWKAVLWLLSHLFLWPMAASEWCCTFYAWQSSSHLFLPLTASQWYCTGCEAQSHYIFFYD